MICNVKRKIGYGISYSAEWCNIYSKKYFTYYRYFDRKFL